MAGGETSCKERTGGVEGESEEVGREINGVGLEGGHGVWDNKTIDVEGKFDVEPLP
jgi:hypothetical protein